MPPRFAYWTIIVEGKPTAFRAQDRDDLVPTFKQLQSTHPDAVMMWFARGRLWSSPDEARAAERGGKDRRGQDWRPGGEHRDPRARFDIPRDEKRRRFAERMRRDERERSGEPESPRPEWKPKPNRRPPQQGQWDRRPPPRDRPGGDRPWRPDKPDRKPKPPGAHGERRPFESRGVRPPRDDRGFRPQGQDEHRGERPWRPKKPDWKPKPPGARGPKPEWKPTPPGARGPKPEWKPKPSGAHGPKPGGGGQGRPSGFRPRGPARRRRA